MSKIVCPVTYIACRAIQSYIIPFTGNYVLTAAGAQGGAGASPGGRGARVEGLFYFRQGEILEIIVGMQGGAGWQRAFAPDHTACGGGGGGATWIWKTAAANSRPTWPLLVAGGGGGGGHETGGAGWANEEPAESDAAGLTSLAVTYPCRHFGGGAGASWNYPGGPGPGPIFCHGGTHWEGGAGIGYGEMCGGDGGYGGGGGGGFLGYAAGGGAGFAGGQGGGQTEGKISRVIRSGGGSSYNSGRYACNITGGQPGNGHAMITALAPSIVLQARPEGVPIVFPKGVT